jgi:hypothetical protein
MVRQLRNLEGFLRGRRSGFASVLHTIVEVGKMIEKVASARRQ